MPVLHIVVLALIQGITEFLPISSSGHLALVPILAGWPDQGLIVDVAVHVGTLGAVILYFWRDVFGMVKGLLMALRGRLDGQAKMVGLIILATIPVVTAGYGLHHYGIDGLRSLNVIAWATLGFGLVLWITDKAGMTVRRVEHLGVSDAVIIGLAQVLALIPGTSRSGITMSAARMLGMERREAARFSMLLSIPTIIGAGALKGYELYQSGDARLTSDAILAAGLAFITALIAIFILMAWLKRSSFTPFVIYRILLGVGLLGLSYGYIS
ncbi:MAG: undecaprenyl-diphosphate phosphatase [Rhodospirillaceae bacterium]|nr:undecaprenyl-diphosphate phosphatase [Rhodospirillaceae bacterium]MBL6940673.1 undecaprenyl-diphosphate phosphatase [Rhodospirillales bacterium]